VEEDTAEEDTAVLGNARITRIRTSVGIERRSRPFVDPAMAAWFTERCRRLRSGLLP